MNVDTLLAAMSGLSRSLATSYLAPMEAAQREFAITTEARSRMWLAQVGHESVSLRYFEEIASGAAYEGRADLGNTQPGDGVRFKGRGPIQLTGRANYTSAGAALKLPLVDNPPMAADPRHAFRVSAWWWATHGLNPIADTGDVIAATRRINGGLNGLADRQSRYDRCRALGAAVIVGGTATPTAPPPEPDDRVAVGQMRDGRFEVFVEQPSGEILHRWNQPGGGWARWASLGTPGK
jgi:putative chitinase